MNKDVARSVAVLLTGIVAIIAAGIGGGATGNRSVNQAVDGWLDSDSTLLAPAGPAFSIWSIIYTGLVVYVVWQLFPTQRASVRHRKLGIWVTLSLLLNAAWILVVQLDQLVLSLVVIVVLLLVLVRAWIIITTTEPTQPADAWITHTTMGLYIGWVSVATVANATAVFAASGLDFGSVGNAAVACILVFVAAGIGILLTLTSGNLSPVIALSWGLLWIGVGRTIDPISIPVAVCSLIAAIVSLVISIAVVVRRASIKK